VALFHEPVDVAGKDEGLPDAWLGFDAGFLAPAAAKRGAPDVGLDFNLYGGRFLLLWEKQMAAPERILAGA
jgi:hypothetical protein